MDSESQNGEDDSNVPWYFCSFCRIVFRAKEDLAHHRQKKHYSKIKKARLAKRSSLSRNNNVSHPISTIQEERVVVPPSSTLSSLSNTNNNNDDASTRNRYQQQQPLFETQSSSLIFNPATNFGPTSSGLIDGSLQEQQPPLPLPPPPQQQQQQEEDELQVVFTKISNEPGTLSSTTCPPSAMPRLEKQHCDNCEKNFFSTESFTAHLPRCNLETLENLLGHNLPQARRSSIPTSDVDQLCDGDSGIFEHGHVEPNKIFGSHVLEESTNDDDDVDQLQQQQQQQDEKRANVHTLHELKTRKRKMSTTSSIPSTSSSCNYNDHPPRPPISEFLDDEGGRVPILRIRRNDHDKYSSSLLQMHRAPNNPPPPLQSLLSPPTTTETAQSITPSPPSLLPMNPDSLMGEKRSPRKCSKLATKPTATTTTFTSRLRERKSSVQYNVDYEEEDDETAPPALIRKDGRKSTGRSSTTFIYPSPASTASSASSTTTTTTTMGKISRRGRPSNKSMNHQFSPSSSTTSCSNTTTTSSQNVPIREYDGPVFFYLAGNFVELRKLSAYSLKDHVYSDVSSFSSISTETNCAIKYDGYGSIYILGGQSGGLYGKATNEIQIYDLSTGKWRMGKNNRNPNPRMINDRCEFEACIVNDYIYAIGGDQRRGNGFWENMNCVEKLPLRPIPGQKWKWESVDFLKYSRQNFGVAALNGIIYVVGGYAGSKNKKTSNAAKATSSVESFNTNVEKDGENPEWQNEPELVKSRVGPCVVATDEGLLYCIGGGTDFNEETSERFDSIEILNPKRKPHRWVMGPTMNRKRQFFSAFVHGKAIYAVGGEYGAHPTIEKFDLETRIWTMVDESILDLTGNYWSIAFKS